jgi:hypothetical protein
MRTVKLPSTGTFLPWHLAIENKEFESHDINLWTDVPEGTGKCVKCCGTVRLTLHINRRYRERYRCWKPSKIVQVYVQSPLIWGIHSQFKI